MSDQRKVCELPSEEDGLLLHDDLLSGGGGLVRPAFGGLGHADGDPGAVAGLGGVSGLAGVVVVAGDKVGK